MVDSGELRLRHDDLPIRRSSTALNIGVKLCMTEPVKRQYTSTVRKRSASATRARIREAARACSCRTAIRRQAIRAAATAAGVGQRTLYDAFPTKSALFGHTLGVATVGGEQPVSVADRPEVLGIQEEADPRAAIAQTRDRPAGGPVGHNALHPKERRVSVRTMSTVVEPFLATCTASRNVLGVKCGPGRLRSGAAQCVYIATPPLGEMTCPVM